MPLALLEPLKVYVLVDPELSASQRAVQGGHALAKLVYQTSQVVGGLGQRLSQWVHIDQTLVYLAADQGTLERALKLPLTMAEFKEPDLNNRLTAIAFAPLTKEQGSEYFSEFSLL